MPAPMKAPPRTEAEMDELFAALERAKPKRGRPRNARKPEVAPVPNASSMTVRLGRNGNGFNIAFPRKADRRTRGPKLCAKVLREIIAELPKPLLASIKHAAERLSMLRVTTSALHEAQLRGENIDTSLLLGAVIEEMRLASRLGLLPRVADRGEQDRNQ
jgi:hypothetical protein